MTNFRGGAITFHKTDRLIVLVFSAALDFEAEIVGLRSRRPVQYNVAFEYLSVERNQFHIQSSSHSNVGIFRLIVSLITYFND